MSEAPDTRSAVAEGRESSARSSTGSDERRVADARESYTDETAGIDPGDAAASRDSFSGDTDDSASPHVAAHQGGSTAKAEEFGPFVVYERLGQGGMATVHRAEKRGIGFRRPVALKRLFPHVAADPELVKLFVDEARLASHLHHANIAQTYELGRVGDTYFMAMEYASGPTLGQIVRQCQQAALEIPLTITVSILTQLCDALDYAHNLCDESGRSLRIIHRDVSPANIIISGTGIVKLIDFGIAKATTSSVKTQTGFIKGKFGYIAPEYITGKIDARVDLFAVGVIAHEILAGRRLFEGKDDFETMANIREMVVAPPSRWNAHVTADLDDIVMTALERDPAKRWQSAGAIQTALASAARAFGVVVGSQQVVEWVEWAFEQIPADSGPLARPDSSADETNAFGKRARLGGRHDSSLSIEVEVASGVLDVSTLPGSTRGASDAEPPAPGPAGPDPAKSVATDTDPADSDPADSDPADSEETVAVERVAMAPGDIEMLTPTPAVPQASGSPYPTPTIPTRAVSAVTPTPTPMRISSIEAASPPLSRAARPALPFGAPSPRGSKTLEAAVPPPPRPPPPPALQSDAEVTSPSLPPLISPLLGSQPLVSPPRGSQPLGSPPLGSQPLVSQPRISPPLGSQPLVSQPRISPPLGSQPLSQPVSQPRMVGRASRQLDSEIPAVASSRDVEVGAPPGSRFEDPAPEVTEPVRAPRKLKPRSRVKSTQKSRPEPRPQASLVPSRRTDPELSGLAPGTGLHAGALAGKRRSVVWLILLMVALGAGAMAAAYYWPEL